MKWERYLEDTHRRATHAVKLKNNLKILDLGCGTGGVIDLLVKRAKKEKKKINIVGIDLTQEMLDIAEEKVGGYSNVQLKLADAHAVLFKPNTFDTVLSVSAFHYFVDPKHAIKEMYRVVKPNGQLVLVDWCNDFAFFRFSDFFLHLLSRAHVKTYTTKELQRLMEQAGFRVKTVRKWKLDWFWRMMLVEGEK